MKRYFPVEYPPIKRGKENKMNDNIIIAAKIIAKSVDALTREIYLLRTAENESLEMNVDGMSVKDCSDTPPTLRSGVPGRPTGCG